FRNGARQHGAAFLQLLVTHRFPSFGDADNLYKIVRSDSGPRFASQNVIQTRERTALVVEPIVVEKWIADTPSGKTIDNNVELVFGRAFRRRSVPGQNAFVKTVYFIDHRQLDLQSGTCNRANDFTKARDDHRFILVNNEEQCSPFERGQDEKNPQERHHSALQKAHNRGDSSGSRSHVNHVHGVLGCSVGSSGNVWRMFFKLSSTMIFFCKLGRIACIASRYSRRRVTSGALRYSASNNENFCASPLASFTRRNAYASACFSRSFAWPRAFGTASLYTAQAWLIAVCFSCCAWFTSLKAACTTAGGRTVASWTC